MSEASTTPDLVELGNRFLEAANRRDLDAMLSFFAPDAVLGSGEALGTFEGEAAIRGFWQGWFASYAELSGEYEEFLDLGNGVTFGVNIGRGRPVGSSAELRFRAATVATRAEDLIERITLYIDIDEARAAAARLAEERG
jgi:ketosteroid isomerase-like protein